MKKLLSIALVVVLLAGMAVTGTMAYLQDTDSDVNVMTLGNVKIKQHEYERVVENGEYKKGTVDEQDSYMLQDFTQGKPLLPIVGDPSEPGNSPAYAGWDDTIVRMTQVDSYGFMQVFAGKNAQDKFVTVENTGRTDAYVRTLVAVEAGETDGSLIGTSHHSNWTKNKIGTVKIGDVNYYVIEYVYKGASDGSRHVGGVLPAGDTSYPNLSQVYISAAATNEDMEKLDGNKNGMLDILVLSQAVQAEGFENAQTALDTAFGKASEKAAEWFGGMDAPVMVSTLDELKAAFAEGGNVVLTEDIEFEKITAIEPGKEVHLDLNGKTITVDENTASNTLIWVKEGAKLTIDGNGTIDLGSVSTMAIFCPYGELVIENGTFTRDEVTTVTNATTGLFMGAKISGCNVTINGGYFDPGYYDENAADIDEILAGTKTLTETADDIAKRGQPGDKNLLRVAVKDNVSVVLNHSGYGSFKVYGGTFVGANPAWGDEGCMLPTTPNYLRPWSYYQGALLAGQTYNENGVVIPDGYTITKGATAENIPTYTVEYGK